VFYGGVLDEYWMCLLGQVSLSVLWRVLGVYWMSVFGMVSFECFTAGIGRVLDVFI
jgi:hypothetical protein